LVGVFSTGIILVTAFRRYYNSPLRKWCNFKLLRLSLIVV
jgi:hypothetical protein